AHPHLVGPGRRLDGRNWRIIIAEPFRAHGRHENPDRETNNPTRNPRRKLIRRVFHLRPPSVPTIQAAARLPTTSEDHTAPERTIHSVPLSPFAGASPLSLSPLSSFWPLPFSPLPALSPPAIGPPLPPLPLPPMPPLPPPPPNALPAPISGG